MRSWHPREPDDETVGPAVRAWRERRTWFENRDEINAAQWCPEVEGVRDYHGMVASTCAHCSAPKRHHVNLKCLFDHTFYEPFGHERADAAWQAVVVEEED